MIILGFLRCFRKTQNCHLQYALLNHLFHSRESKVQYLFCHPALHFVHYAEKKVFVISLGLETHPRFTLKAATIKFDPFGK